jgi:hypothetical protein
MKNTILIAMSLLSLLFGCNTKKSPPKAEAWPRFPATDNTQTTVTAVPLTDGFTIQSFYIAPDKQHLYVLGSRQPTARNPSFPGEPAYVDYRLLCLDATGKTLYHKDMLRTDWMYGGTFGLLEGELLLRIGDYFLVLEPSTLTVKEKIKIHTSEYVSWKEKTMTFDEHRDDYQAKFDALLNNCKTCKCLYWPLHQEYLVLVPGRTAWSLPQFFEDGDLDALKQRLAPLTVTLNPQVSASDSTHLAISDNPAQIREIAYLSDGTQLVYPNYKSRTVVQYELTLNDKKIHFSTSDRDAHSLHLRFSDNLMLSMADGSVWVIYDDLLYKINNI